MMWKRGFDTIVKVKREEGCRAQFECFRGEVKNVKNMLAWYFITLILFLIFALMTALTIAGGHTCGTDLRFLPLWYPVLPRSDGPMLQAGCVPIGNVTSVNP